MYINMKEYFKEKWLTLIFLLLYLITEVVISCIYNVSISLYSLLSFILGYFVIKDIFNK